MSNPRPVGGRLISAAILFFAPLAVLCVLLILKRLVFGIGSVTALNGGKVPVAAAAQSEGQIATGAVIGTFTVRNEHGLHARPSAVLVNEVKKFTSKITVQNLTRETAPVSAKSLMKIVALGVTQGHRLRFVASGEEAQQAIEGIGAVIESGLGEGRG